MTPSLQIAHWLHQALCFQSSFVPLKGDRMFLYKLRVGNQALLKKAPSFWFTFPPFFRLSSLSNLLCQFKDLQYTKVLCSQNRFYGPCPIHAGQLQTYLDYPALSVTCAPAPLLLLFFLLAQCMLFHRNMEFGKPLALEGPRGLSQNPWDLWSSGRVWSPFWSFDVAIAV